MHLHTTTNRWATLVPTPSGLRAVIRAASGRAQVWRHPAGGALTDWRPGATTNAMRLTAPSATALADGSLIAVSESDHVVSVQRYTNAGTPAAIEFSLTGYTQPSIASDGHRVWIVMIRLADGLVVSREYDPAIGWASHDRLEIGPEVGGWHNWPNLMREVDDGRLRFVVRGAAGTSKDHSSTLALQRPVGPARPAAAAPFPGCPPLSASVIRGSAAGGRLTGTVRGDRIFGGTGNDIVDGLAGDDCIDLGPGTDRAQGGLGNDLMLGGLGEDRMSGSTGNDRVRGGSSSDRINGGFGDDRLHGQEGKDRVHGSRGRDRINGGSANDVILAGSSPDRVAGDQGSDRINGNSSNDVLKGNSGHDRLTGSTGRDRISGGSGNDRINARDGRGGDRVSCGIGRDRVVADRGDRVTRSCERVRRR